MGPTFATVKFVMNESIVYFAYAKTDRSVRPWDYGTQLLPCRVSERVFCALKFRDALDFSSVAQKYLVVTRVHMPRDGNGLIGVGRTRDLPQKVLQDWMASNLFTKKSAQSIFAAVEAYAAARGYSPREATDLRHQLTPRMITFAAGQVVGKRVVRIKH